VAAALAAFDRRWRHLGLLPPLLAVTAAGIWACVPDVEGPLVLLGASLLLPLLGWPSPLAARWPGLAAFGTAGSVAMAAVLVWVVATGGVGRPGSVVGGLACLGLLAVEPAVRRLDVHRRSPLELLEQRPGLTWTAVAAHLLLVGIASRVTGRPERVGPALVLFLLEFGTALVVGIALVRLPALDRRTHP
jgi:hypothetical protein